jgi:hypothetical protein
MESLALIVSIIVFPAMFGGPISLLLSLYRPAGMSRFRRIFIILSAILSIIVGVFLLIENVSRGANVIGALGLSTGLGSLWQLKRYRKVTP